MNLEKLKFVKNIDAAGWAYQDWQKGSQQQLNWPKSNETNANKANAGDLILLVQKPPHLHEARVTHLVEVSTDAAETINEGDWGIIRPVSVIWVADFTHESCIPRDQDLFGWKRHRAEGPNVVALTNIKDGRIPQLWHSWEIFQRHVAGMLGLIES